MNELPLRQQLIQELALRNYARNMIEAYLRGEVRAPSGLNCLREISKVDCARLGTWHHLRSRATRSRIAHQDSDTIPEVG